MDDNANADEYQAVNVPPEAEIFPKIIEIIIFKLGMALHYFVEEVFIVSAEKCISTCKVPTFPEISKESDTTSSD